MASSKKRDPKDGGRAADRNAARPLLWEAGMGNPRYRNGNLRRKLRARLKAMGLPCAICGQPIHYDEPSDPNHPLSFVIDEITPVSRYREGGYDTAAAAAQDWNNLQACHYVCNQMKSNRTMEELKRSKEASKRLSWASDGDW